MEKLESLASNLIEVQEISERHRNICFFKGYYTNYERYKKSYAEASKLIKEEAIENLALEIPQLSTEEIAGLIKKGEDNAVIGGYLSDIAEYSKKLASQIHNVIVLCENASEAGAYLKDACHKKDRAKMLLAKSDWNGAVVTSQKCIEQSIQALFKLAGVKHPLKKDPTKKIKEVAERLNLQGYKLKDFTRIRWIAKVWATAHQEIMYAFKDIPAREFFTEKDGKIFLDYANEVYLVCSRLVDEIGVSQLKT